MFPIRVRLHREIEITSINTSDMSDGHPESTTDELRPKRRPAELTGHFGFVLYYGSTRDFFSAAQGAWIEMSSRDGDHAHRDRSPYARHVPWATAGTNLSIPFGGNATVRPLSAD